MGKMFIFIFIIWMAISLSGAVTQGHISVATTHLTTNITADDTTIPVEDTSGFPNVGVVVIGSERIAYSNLTATTITGSLAQPLIRGTSNTTAAAHLSGDRVRTVESSMANQSAQYNIALIADATGPWAAVTIPLAVMRLIASFFKPPMHFLGSDLQILFYIYWALIAAMVIVVGLALAGGRRV